jgi:putative transposase
MGNGGLNARQNGLSQNCKQRRTMMQLVEQHIIKRGDSRYQAIDQAAFASKNLYNLANYHMRQSFIHTGKYLGYAEVYHLVKQTDAYKALPRKVSNDVLRLLEKNWKAFRKALAAWYEDLSQFLGRPKLPKYKDKQKGRNVLIYDIQALSKKGLKRGLIQPSQLGIIIQTKQTTIQQARIILRKGYYVIEVVYKHKEVQATVDPTLIAGIDIGVNNLAAVISNKNGFIPRLVNGRPLKSTNQFYNKRKAKLQKQVKNDHWTARLERMTNKRTRRIDHYLHTASRRIIDLLVAEGIGTQVIGKNRNWKQACEMRKPDKQHFVQLPHARFVNMLCYKAKLVGIQVVLQEESYTSQASFLDGDPIPTYGQVTEEPAFSGRRLKRGLYKAKSGRKFNADINGSYNILRKASPNGFPNGVEAVAVQPVRLAV